jgi:hypothetical protein
MDGSINFSGTLAGSIADSGGGKIQDVQTNASGDYVSVVDEQGVAKIDLSNYATDEQLESAVDNINSVLLTKQNIVNYSIEEQIIGIWSDGKPIYQKTISINNVTIGNTSITNITNVTDFSNIKQIIDGKGYYTESGDEGAFPLVIFRYNSNIYVKSIEAFVCNKLTLQYTKITD